jgi:hypothetical protein
MSDWTNSTHCCCKAKSTVLSGGLTRLAYQAERATKTHEADQGETPVHPHKSPERRVPDTEAAIQEIKEEVINGVTGNPHKSPEAYNWRVCEEL